MHCLAHVPTPPPYRSKKLINHGPFSDPATGQRKRPLSNFFSCRQKKFNPYLKRPYVDHIKRPYALSVNDLNFFSASGLNITFWYVINAFPHRDVYPPLDFFLLMVCML